MSAAGSAPPIRHGGDLDAARRAFPAAPEPWLDLSTGINPVAWAIPPLSPETWTRLPGCGALAALEAAARAAYGAGPGTAVVAAPGTQALIQALPRLRPARRVGILGFTYQEHAAAWRRHGADVTVVEALPDLAGFDVAVLVNPNNPDGRLVGPADLAAFAGARPSGSLVVVDEAFMDVMPAAASLVPHRPAGTVVLRSFGKAYGLAGLRLGFALADPDLAEALRADLGPWAVSGPALAVGTAALEDAGWLAAARDRLGADALRLDALLERAGARILGGTPLFRLIDHPAAQALADRLGRAGILVRRFDDPNRLRFGLPGRAGDWDRLREALGA